MHIPPVPSHTSATSPSPSLSPPKANYTAHGYGGYFILSLLDRKWKPNMSMDEAKDVMKQCIAEVQKRLVVQLPKFTVHSVDAQGTHAVEL